jgi:hypothetical protein
MDRQPSTVNRQPSTVDCRHPPDPLPTHDIVQGSIPHMHWTLVDTGTDTLLHPNVEDLAA